MIGFKGLWQLAPTPVTAETLELLDSPVQETIPAILPESQLSHLTPPQPDTAAINRSPRLEGVFTFTHLT